MTPLLLENRADVGTYECSAQSLLQIASDSRNWKTTKLLLENAADLNASFCFYG